MECCAFCLNNYKTIEKRKETLTRNIGRTSMIEGTKQNYFINAFLKTFKSIGDNLYLQQRNIGSAIRPHRTQFIIVCERQVYK